MAAKKVDKVYQRIALLLLLCTELPFPPHLYATWSELWRIRQQNGNSYSIHYSNAQEKISATDLAVLWHWF